MNLHLREFIEMHSEMKRLNVQIIFKIFFTLIFTFHFDFLLDFRLAQVFGAISQPIFMVFFAWALAATCAGMLALQIQMVY